MQPGRGSGRGVGTDEAHEPVPGGVATFLFTDIEGSTQLWERAPVAMERALGRHDELIESAISVHGGRVFSRAGDSFAAAFALPQSAVRAAVAAQVGLTEERWPPDARLRVRMGIHSGVAQQRRDSYYGTEVNRAARVMAAAHGGQIVVTDLTRALLRSVDEVRLRSLGEISLRGLSEPVAVHQVLLDGLPDDFPPLVGITPPHAALPVAPTEMLGRSDAVVAVCDRLATSRLVTLTGPGGVGKTRLAVAAAETVLDDFPDGVFFVDLSEIGENEQVAPAIADALRLQLLTGEPVDQLVQHLAARRVLIIVDNCEHVIAAVAGFAARFLATPGQGHVLATSRERLDIEGEQVFRTQPLAVGDGEPSPARDLFLRRARALGADVSTEPTALAAIDELCRHLDGLPLAIELAAARTPSMTAFDLLAHIDEVVTLLSAGAGRDGRRRTLEATIAWSCDLLEPHERTQFRRLGAFVGSFDAGAGAAVWGVDEDEALRLLDSLIAKSLVVRSGTGRRGRYRLLETVRAYARLELERTHELEAVLGAHAAHYRDRLARDAPWYPADVHESAALVADWGNITTAFDRLVDRDEWLDAAALVSGLHSLVVDHGFAYEARYMVDACLDHAEVIDDALVDQVRWVGAWVALVTDDWLEHIVRLDELTSAADPTLRAWSVCLRAMVEFVTSPDRARARIAEGFAIASSPGAPERAEIFPLGFRAIASLFDGEFEAALVDFEHAAQLLARVPETITLDAFMSDSIATTLILLARPAEALTVLDRPPIPSAFERSRLVRAVAHADLGDVAAARALLVEEARARIGNRTVAGGSNDTLIGLAALAIAESDDERARTLLTGAGLPRDIHLFPLGLGLAARIGAEQTLLDHYRRLARSTDPLASADDLVRDQIERIISALATAGGGGEPSGPSARPGPSGAGGWRTIGGPGSPG